MNCLSCFPAPLVFLLCLSVFAMINVIIIGDGNNVNTVIVNSITTSSLIVQSLLTWVMFVVVMDDDDVVVVSRSDDSNVLSTRHSARVCNCSPC